MSNPVHHNLKNKFAFDLINRKIHLKKKRKKY